MAHLARKQLVAFFRLFPPGYIEEDAEHDAIHDVSIIPLAAGRYPPDDFAQQDAEIDLIRPCNRPGGHESSANPVSVCWMNMS
jgi:hypothetical protein